MFLQYNPRLSLRKGCNLKKVLIMTNSNDGLNTQVIERHLDNLGASVVRMDMDRITKGESTLSLEYSKDKTYFCYDDVSLEGVGSVWFRRPFSFNFNIEDDEQKHVAEEEFRDVLSSMFELLNPAFWVSRPEAIASARLKPYQIAVAKKVGFNVPETIVTNDDILALDFCNQGPSVFKPMSGYSFEYDGLVHTAYTTIITPEILKNISLVRNQHVMLQRYVTKSCEIRITCVGDNYFATKLYSDNFEGIVDHRTPDNYLTINYEPVVLPGDVQAQIHTLLKELGLEYAAIDLAITSEGEYTFFEVNPIGQWLWIEEITGQPISKCLAMHLVSGC